MLLRLVFLAAFLFSAFLSNAQDNWDLKQCIDYAIENNITIKQQQINEQVAQNNLTQSKASLYPDLNGDMSYNVNFGRSLDPTTFNFETQTIQSTSYGLTSRITLFSGLRQLNNIKQSEYNLLANRYRTQELINNISLNVTSAFLNILLAKESVKTAQNQVELSLSQMKQTEQLVKSGVIPEGDLFLMESQLANDSLSLVTAENGLSLSKLGLALLLQINDVETFDITGPDMEQVAIPTFIGESAEEVYQVALNKQPEIKGAEFSVKGAERSLRIAKGLSAPIISFSANIRTNHSSLGRTEVDRVSVPFTIGNVDDGSSTPVISSPIVTQAFSIPIFENTSVATQYQDNLNQTLGISMTIPIFNGLSTKTSIRNANLQLQTAEYNQKLVKDQLKQNIYQAYADAVAALNRFKSTEKNVTALKKSFEYAQKRYTLGASNNLEFNTAKTNLAFAEISLLNAKYDYIFAVKVLDFYLGNPITLD